MQHSKMGKLVKAVTLSLLMLAMTSGLAGWQPAARWGKSPVPSGKTSLVFAL